jgi:hypothetical protein
LLAFIGQKARMTINEIGNLGLDGLRQKLPRTTAQNFSQRILKCTWLGELNDIILGHGVSSFRNSIAASLTVTILSVGVAALTVPASARGGGGGGGGGHSHGPPHPPRLLSSTAARLAGR